jgi:hypothetical protein
MIQHDRKTIQVAPRAAKPRRKTTWKAGLLFIGTARLIAKRVVGGKH